MIEDVVQVDSLSGKNIPELRRRLVALACQIQDFQQKWLPGWFAVMDELAKDERPYLEWDDWQNLCARHRLKDDAKTIARVGHLTGMLLWRDELPQGAELVVLKPDWLSRAVARILQCPEAQKRHGLVSLDHLRKLWRKGGADDPAYPEQTHDLLIALIEANELGYRPRLPGEAAPPPKELLLTQMVKADRPPEVKEKWDEAGEGESVEETRVVSFRKADKNENGKVPWLIYLLIFRLRRLAIPTKEAQSIHWQHGLMVRDESDGVGLIEQEGDELRIRVRGVNPSTLLATIVFAIGEERDRMWQGLVKTTYMLCGEHCPRGKGDEGRFERKRCIDAVREQVTKLPCPIADCGRFVEVDKLLHAPRVAQSIRATLTNLEGLMREVLGVAQQNNQAVELHRRETARSSNHTHALLGVLRNDVRDLRTIFEAEMNQLVRAMADEGRHGPRLFSVKVLEPGFWNKPTWMETRLKVTLWCEHSLRPLPVLEKIDAYDPAQEITVPREWLVKAVPWLKRTVRMLIMVKLLGPVAAAAGAGIEIPKTVQSVANEWEPELAMIQALEEISRNESRLDPAWPAEEPPVPRPFRAEDVSAYGSPLEPETRAALALRDLYVQKDPHWGGLRGPFMSERGLIWVHPKYVPIYVEPKSA